MIIKQISVFLENTAGRIADVTRILKEGGINIATIVVDGVTYADTCKVTVVPAG